MSKPNPLRRAHEAAAQDTHTLGLLFSRLGNLKNPYTPLLSSYRLANRALRDVVKHGGGIRHAKEITRGLRASMASEVRPLLRQAQAAGMESARLQMSYYGVTPPPGKGNEDSVDMAFDVVEAKLNAQETALLAMLLGGADEELILGNDRRQGVLRPIDVISPAIFWITALFWGGFNTAVHKSRRASGFNKQVIATLDHRVTDCCLRAHGQVVELESKFHLTGTPRYADYLEWTPFHDRCRTSIALYLPEYDDGLTDAMLEGAQTLLAEREAGINTVRRPANAILE